MTMLFFYAFPAYQSHHVFRRLRFGPTPSVAVLLPQKDLGMRETANNQIPCLCLTQRWGWLHMKMKALLKVQTASPLSELISHSGAFALQSHHLRTTIQRCPTTPRDPHAACQHPQPVLIFLHQMCQSQGENSRSNQRLGKAAAGKEVPLLMEACWKHEG